MLIFAHNQDIPMKGLLFTRISDLIKMAFTASTAYVAEIRLEGLVVLKDIIEVSALSASYCILTNQLADLQRFLPYHRILLMMAHYYSNNIRLR